MFARLSTFAAVLLFVSACPRSGGIDLPDGAIADGATTNAPDSAAMSSIDAQAVDDVGPTGDARTSADVATLPTNKVDLLLMIDNSNSMAEEQAAISRELPLLIRALTTGDIDDDGTLEFPAVRDLHVGVISTDMGSLGYNVPTCTSILGDDGAMRNQGNPALSGGPACPATFPAAFFSFIGGAPRDRFIRDVQCVAVVGTGGCGFEQPLEAVLKALTPSTAATRFLGTSETGPTLGQGDRANAGFLRDDSVLAVVVLTDEEDCSVLDPRIFQVEGGPYNVELNIRCSQYPEAQQPVSRYSQGLRALRASHPNRFVFSAIVGVPAQLLPRAGEAIDYAAILNDPAMEHRIDPASMFPNRFLIPSCQTASGAASAPRRIVELTRDLGSNGTLHSICTDSYREATTTLVTKIATALR